MFLEVIHSWLDIQTKHEKNVLGKKKSSIKQNAEHKNTKSNKSGFYIIYYLPKLF